MPAPLTASDLIALLRKSGLVPQDRLDAALASMPGFAADAPRELTTRLVACGVITNFQAEQLLLGKHRGFTLGKYRVLEKLGSGGMGTVYLCEHQAVGKKAAIKVLPSSQSANPSSLGRFYREARAAGLMDHPNLVRAHDVDEEGGVHFLVMDYVDGSSLQEIVARFGPMSPARACHVIREAALGLDHAYRGGLVHRDVKPANIMIERGGAVRVLDLGLARFHQDETDPLTLKYDDKHVLGTADYVAPEQALNSHEVDQRADIYSLGCTLYFLLTGRPPFPDGKVAQKLVWHQVRQPTPVRQLRPEVPESIVAVLSRMIAKEPAERFQTHAEVAAALEALRLGPVPPPREEEMPRLCPAARHGMSSHTQPRPARREPPARVAPTAPSRAPGTSARKVAERPEVIRKPESKAAQDTSPVSATLPAPSKPTHPPSILGQAAFACLLAALCVGAGVGLAFLFR